LVFPIALAVYLVVRRVEGTFGPVAFTVLIAVLLVAMYSITTEEFATMVVFGGLALLVAFVISSREVRGRLLRTAGLIVVAGGVAGIVLSPYLYDALRHVPPRTIRSATHGSADLLGFVVPRTSTWIGGHTMRNVSAHFTAGVVEDGSYLSIPLVIGLVVFAVMRRRDRATWILLSIAAAAVLLSLGPVLHVKGHQSVTLPEDVLTHLPVVKNVAPVRFALYMWLAVAVAVAAWLALPGRLRWLRWAVVVLSAVLILPDVASPPYHPPVRVPPFITDGLYRRYLSPGEIVLIVPYGKGGEMLWQADAEMYFRIPRGYIGPLPAPYVNQPLARNLATGLPSTIPAPFQLRTFLQLHQVDAIAVADPHPKAWDDLIRPIGGKSIHAGDVDLYRLSR
jgi:hypothetical protein